jgi:hypothetical protein
VVVCDHWRTAVCSDGIHSHGNRALWTAVVIGLGVMANAAAMDIAIRARPHGVAENAHDDRRCSFWTNYRHYGMYGPPRCCKRKVKMTVGSAQMYPVFD